MKYLRNDIREQLPEDSERFAKIDRTWREIMSNARTNANVLQACAVPGLHSQLQDIHYLQLLYYDIIIICQLFV